MAGRFISFEGGEGAGKSTQVGLLAERLRSAGLEVVVTREPGGTPGAEEIRALVLTGVSDRWSPVAELLLMNAARADHVERVIRPALVRGAWVISDRYADSSFVYQGAAKGVALHDLEAVHAVATGGLWPDLTIILDLEVFDGFFRVFTRQERHLDRFESEEGAFHEMVQQAFRDIARNNPKRCRLVNADASIEAVSEQVWTEVKALL